MSSAGKPHWDYELLYTIVNMSSVCGVYRLGNL